MIIQLAHNNMKKNIFLDNTPFKDYMSKIIYINGKVVVWYDAHKTDFRAGIITEVEDDDIYIKAFDNNEEIAWPR